MSALRVVVVVLVVLGWLVALAIAAVDGRLPLLVTTPILTTVVGWLFTTTVTGGGSS